MFSLTILATFHTIFSSSYFVLFQYFHDILLKYTGMPNLEVAVWSGDLPSLLMAILFRSKNTCTYLIKNYPRGIVKKEYFGDIILGQFFLFLHKNMLWILIRSSSLRHF